MTHGNNQTREYAAFKIKLHNLQRFQVKGKKKIMMYQI